MADLSAFLNFNVLLDKSGVTPVIVLTDTSAYPTGVSVGVTGIFSVTQPDGIVITGSFGTPDVTYSGSGLTSKTIELRLATDGNFQKGQYLITYTVHHTDYTGVNVLTKSFALDYTAPVLKLMQDFDVFLPRLQVIDQTTYTLAGFTSPTLGRAWHATISGIGSLNGTGSSFDLVYGNDYYDSKYAVTLTAIVTYGLASASWVSIEDKLTITGNFTTYVPASLTQIYNDLSAYQIKIPDCGCGCDANGYTEANYVYAFSLFQHLIMKLKAGDTFNIKKMVDNIYCVLQNGVQPVHNVTNAAIESYTGNFPGNATDPTGGVVPLTIITQPASANKNEGQSITFTVGAAGGVTPYSYQWYVSSDGGATFASISGATVSTYTLSGIALSDNNKVYRAKVTDFASTSIFSGNATLTVNSVSMVQVTFGYSTTDPFVDEEHDITVSNFTNVSVPHNSDLSLTFTSAAPDNYIEIKVPATESLKNIFNNGTNTLVGNTVPADEFRRYTYNGFTYYIARNPLGFVYTQPLNFLA